MRSKALARTSAIAIVIVIVVAAIGIYYALNLATPTQTVSQRNKLGVVFDIGGRGDLSFNDMAALGADRATKDFGLQLVEVQSKTQDDYLPNLRNLARSKEYLLIVGVGFLLTDAMNTVAVEFPEQKFAIIDGFIPDKANVLSILFKENEGSALVGALGALVATEYGFNKIGVVLGIEIPVLWKFEIGYKWGAKWGLDWLKQNRPAKARDYSKDFVLWAYTGSFSDPAKGKTAAEAQFAQGAAVSYNVAGATGLGIFEAAEALGKAKGLTRGPPFGIGVDADQDWVKPGFIIASMMKRVDIGVYTAAKQAKEGTFKGGILELGLKEGGVAISQLEDLSTFLEIGVKAGKVKAEDRDRILSQVRAMREAQPPYFWQAVNGLADLIKTGKVEVPKATTRDDIDRYRGIYG